MATKRTRFIARVGGYWSEYERLSRGRSLNRTDDDKNRFNRSRGRLSSGPIGNKYFPIPVKSPPSWRNLESTSIFGWGQSPLTIVILVSHKSHSNLSFDQGDNEICYYFDSLSESHFVLCDVSG